PGEHAERHRLLGVDRAAARPTRDALAAEQRERRELQRLERGGDDEQLPAGLEAVDGTGDGLAVRRGRQHEVRSSKLLQPCGGGAVGGVDVLVRAELLRELPLVGAARDRDRPETHLRGELDGEVSEAADALDRHGVPRTRAAVAERVVGGDSGAEQGSGVLGVELLGDPRGGFVRDDDVLCVTAVEADARHLRPLAVEEESLAAGSADEAVTAVPADAYPVALLPLRDVGADLVDTPGDLVARNARQLETRIGPHLDQRVTVAEAAGFDLDADLVRRRLRQLPLD